MLSEPYSACCCWGTDPYSSPDWTALADLHPVVLLSASRDFHHVRRMVRNLWKCNSWDGSTNLTQTSLHEKRGRMIRELDHPRDKAETSYTKTFAKQCSWRREHPKHVIISPLNHALNRYERSRRQARQGERRRKPRTEKESVPGTYHECHVPR